MSESPHPTVSGAPPGDGPGAPDANVDTSELSTAQLVARMTEHTSTLVRDEVQLAKADIQQTVREVGAGAGLFGAAGLTALYGLGALVAAAILGLGHVVDPWLSALVVSVVLFGGAGLAAALGRAKVRQAPSALDATKRNVAKDVEAVKGARS